MQNRRERLDGGSDRRIPASAILAALDLLCGAGDLESADADGRTLQGVGKGRSRGRRTLADARQQHLGLPLEQGQHLALQAPLSERHPRQMRRIDGTLARNRRRRFDQPCNRSH